MASWNHHLVYALLVSTLLLSTIVRGKHTLLSSSLITAQIPPWRVVGEGFRQGDVQVA